MKEKQITTKSRTARQNRTFRLSDYESRKLSEGAKAARMNESKYVRELIIHGGVDATHAEDRRNLIRQVSGIATISIRWQSTVMKPDGLGVRMHAG